MFEVRENHLKCDRFKRCKTIPFNLSEYAGCTLCPSPLTGGERFEKWGVSKAPATRLGLYWPPVHCESQILITDTNVSLRSGTADKTALGPPHSSSGSLAP